MNADLSYPIIVRRQGGRFVIMDGIHRLLKAVILDQGEITAKIFDERYAATIARTAE